MKRLAFLILLLAAPAFAQEPTADKLVVKVSIAGDPAKVHAGELVVLDSAGTTGDKTFWAIYPPSKNFLAIDGNKRAVFAALPGTWFVILAGADADELAVVTYTLTVGGVVPVPPGPGPSPVPVPVPTPSKQLPDLVDGWADKVSGVTKDERERLAGSFESIAAQLSAGVTMTGEQVVLATKASNGLALGARLAQWSSFSQELGKHLNALSAKGELDHAELWRQIAEGLRK